MQTYYLPVIVGQAILDDGRQLHVDQVVLKMSGNKKAFGSFRTKSLECLSDYEGKIVFEIQNSWPNESCRWEIGAIRFLGVSANPKWGITWEFETVPESEKIKTNLPAGCVEVDQLKNLLGDGLKKRRRKARFTSEGGFSFN